MFYSLNISIKWHLQTCDIRLENILIAGSTLDTSDQSLDATLPYNPADPVQPQISEELDEIDFPHLNDPDDSPAKSDDEFQKSLPRPPPPFKEKKVKTPVRFNVINCSGEQKVLEIISNENGRKLQFVIDQAANRSLQARRRLIRYLLHTSTHYYTHITSPKFTKLIERILVNYLISCIL